MLCVCNGACDELSLVVWWADWAKLEPRNEVAVEGILSNGDSGPHRSGFVRYVCICRKDGKRSEAGLCMVCACAFGRRSSHSHSRVTN